MTIFAPNGFGHMKKSYIVTDKPLKGNTGGVWRKADVFKFNKTLTRIPLYKCNVSLLQHHKKIMGILKGFQVTVTHPSGKLSREKSKYILL